ncbi:lipopolysaccharide export system protein LptC [Sphingomonas laterariae]|uniref:Lipopolysaccharide export system protein LptC n=1 Tax=Edaphosphingomonas laterariae TaxID=861865 RepID=A0A239KXC9_9SPHN|nr:LPS export ABC transporter periplasmic protein LptC [Sphingomonas laterariae]SNT22298.1 lipopolysaccharide export system protein LptC [Sphingomonas laterariae]
MSKAADLARGHRQVWAAPGASHDRVIGLLRILLPAGIGALVAILAVAPLTMGRDISFVLAKDRVEVAKERLRVSDAVYRGEDTKGQAFSIRAGSAVQTRSSDPVVRLADLSAQIQLPEGPATIGAKTGRYDMNSEKVFVDGAVRFQTADGYQLDTRDVAVDLKTRQVASGGAVDGTMPLGNFSANRMTADLPNRTVVLDGRARLHIVQRGGR